MEVIKIPEVAGKRSLVEVLSQVVKLERSSSSSASEMTSRTPPEAPDIVTSTTKGRERRVVMAKRAVGGGGGGLGGGGEVKIGADVATLAILCQHYAELVHALKEENYLLSCARSPLPTTPRSTLSYRGTATDPGARGPVGGSSGGRTRTSRTAFSWEPEAVAGLEQQPRQAGEDEAAVRATTEENTRLISDLRVPGSPAGIRAHRTSSGSRERHCGDAKSPRKSPGRGKEEAPEEGQGGQPEALVRERKPWTLRPLRSAKHKRDSRPPRKSSFSIFMRDSSKEQEKAAKENANAGSPKLSRSSDVSGGGGGGAGAGGGVGRGAGQQQRVTAAEFRNPTVGVLSTKIQEIEEKIQEILHLEPVDIIMRENSLTRSPTKGLSGTGSLRRSASVGQRGDFYRHAVKDTRRDQLP
ncbi:uncharacterized protein LOC119596177 [Penaeus monodon]|uniref:uncharacterized protein LOC119596177 n=1 Tax=Penaeus monodon TaxID=6687 RepID=UPI0018A719D7|nr:uncharacterized protein LOC119596177 [Penaeus monodon]